MHALTAIQLWRNARGHAGSGRKLGGVFNVGGAAVANYVSILERCADVFGPGAPASTETSEHSVRKGLPARGRRLDDSLRRLNGRAPGAPPSRNEISPGAPEPRTTTFAPTGTRFVEVDRVLVDHADAPRRRIRADRPRLSRSVDAEQRVLLFCQRYMARAPSGLRGPPPCPMPDRNSCILAISSGWPFEHFLRRIPVGPRLFGIDGRDPFQAKPCRPDADPRSASPCRRP